MAFATLNGVTIHYRLTGRQDGLPLILVNSLGTDLRIWEGVLPHLGSRYWALTYDKRGHGLSDAPAGPYSLDDHAADLLGLACHAGFEGFAICGISVGGMIAMRVASKHPDKVRVLVLCDTAAVIGTAASWNERIAAVEAGGMAAISEAVIERWVSPGYRTSRPAEFAGWRNMVERCPAAGYVATCATVRDADLRDELLRIELADPRHRRRARCLDSATSGASTDGRHQTCPLRTNQRCRTCAGHRAVRGPCSSDQQTSG